MLKQKAGSSTKRRNQKTNDPTRRHQSTIELDITSQFKVNVRRSSSISVKSAHRYKQFKNTHEMLKQNYYFPHTQLWKSIETNSNNFTTDYKNIFIFSLNSTILCVKLITVAIGPPRNFTLFPFSITQQQQPQRVSLPL